MVETRVAWSDFPGLRDGLLGPGQVKDRDLKVSTYMTATLTGPSFDIPPPIGGDDARAVLPGEAAVWRWQVVPKESGSQPIFLTLRAVHNGNPLGQPGGVVDYMEVSGNLVHGLSKWMEANGEWAVALALGLGVALGQRSQQATLLASLPPRWTDRPTAAQRVRVTLRRVRRACTSSL